MRALALVATLFAVCATTPPALAIEEPAYEVVQQSDELELRDYAPYFIVSTPAGTVFEDAGSQGFRTLFRYISGANQSGEDMAMTAPVLQARGEEQWALAFVVPGSYAPDAIPVPQAEGVRIEQVPGGLYAAARFSGRWTEQRFMDQEVQLLARIESAGLQVCGPTRFARYDPPFKPAFMRRNEILIPVGKESCPAPAT
jgi:hypothetical protein